MNEFIYSYLSSHFAYQYLEYSISINSGYLYLKARNKLLNKNYLDVSKNKHVFKNLILLRVSTMNLIHILEKQTQQIFNQFVIDNFIYKDISSNRLRKEKDYILKYKV